MNCGLLVLLAPLLAMLAVILIPYAALFKLWRWLRREPKPTIPTVVSNPDLPAEQVAKTYFEKAKELLPDVTANHRTDSEYSAYELRSKQFRHKLVEYYYEEDVFGIGIDGLSTSFWNLTEQDNLDYEFWITIGVLRYGTFKTRTWFGKNRYWVKLDELGVWVKMFPEGSSQDSSGMYSSAPLEVQKAFAKK